MNLKKITQLYQNNYIFKSDINAPKLENNLCSIRKLFSSYACLDFAYATHLNTGWKVFQVDFFTRRQQKYAPYHIVLKKDNSDLFFDINGFSTFEELNVKYNGNIKYTEIYEITPCPFLITDEAGIEIISTFSRSLLK